MVGKIVKVVSLYFLFMSGVVNAFSLESQYGNEYQHMYFGLGYSSLEVDISASGVGNVTLDSSLLGLIVGYQLHENFAIEGRGYGNVSDDEILGSTFSVDNHFSVIGKAILPLHESFKPYAMLGYGKTKVSFDGMSERDNDIIYGLGFAVSNSNRVQLELEWMRLYDESFDVKLGADDTVGTKVTGDSINLNFIYHFPAR